MTKFRTAIIASTIAALMGAQAFAAEPALAPGRPASVQQAVRHGARLWATIGIAAVVASAVVIAMNSSNSATPPASPATTTTTP